MNLRTRIDNARIVRALRPAATANDPTEPATEVDDLGRFFILQDAGDLCCNRIIKIVRLAKKMPRQLLR